MTIQHYTNDLIHDNPYQKRSITPESVTDLAESIGEHNLQDIPTARPHPTIPGHVELVKGHRRRVAWFIAKPDQPMPLDVVENVSDRQMFEMNAIENAHRLDLDGIEKASQMQEYIQTFGGTQEEAGKLFNLKTQGAVSNLLSMLKLPEDIQGMVRRRELAERHARQFATVIKAVPAKQLSKIARQAIKHPMLEEREEFIDELLEDALWRECRNLNNTVRDWPDGWPGTPIPVDPHNAGKNGFPEALIACAGCPNRLKDRKRDLCALPACYDLKAFHWKANQIKKASERLAIPLAELEQAKEPDFHILFDGTRHDKADDARTLIKAKRQTELGLWLLPTDTPNQYYGHDVFGTIGVALCTSDKSACDRYLDAIRVGYKKPGDKPIDPAKAKQFKAKQVERRRDERAAALKAKHDASWLIAHSASAIGDRLNLTGGVLVMLIGEIRHSERIHDFDLLEAWEDDIENKLDNTKGAEREGLLRQQIAFRLLVKGCCLHDVKGKAEYDIDFIRRKIADMATDGKDYGALEGGFCVNLPAEWDKLPVHHTPFNCWHCGRFANSKKLTQRDQKEGWVIAQSGKQLLDVHCPDCIGTPMDGAKPMAKRKAKSKAKVSRPKQAKGKKK